jgi:hypothetical protein
MDEMDAKVRYCYTVILGWKAQFRMRGNELYAYYPAGPILFVGSCDEAQLLMERLDVK